MRYLEILSIIIKDITRSKKYKLLMIAIGLITFFIIVGKGYQLGLKKQIDSLQYYGYTGDIIIVNSNVKPKNKPDFLSVEKDKLLKYDNIKLALLNKFSDRIEYILPRYITKCMIMGEDEELYEYITLLGVDFSDEHKIGIFKLFNFIDLSPVNTEDGIYISNKVAKKLNLKLGDNVYCFITSKEGMPRTAKFIVAGIFESKGFPALMEFLSCVEFKKLNKILKNKIQECSYIQIILKNKNNLNNIRGEMKELLKHFNCKFYEFGEAAPFLNSIKKTVDYTSFVSLLFQYIVIFLFIYSSIHMSIIRKRKEIAIMYAVGLSVKEVILFFIIEVFVLILSPALIGMLCGLCVNYVVSIVGIPAINEAMKYMFASDRLYFDFNITSSISIVIMMVIIGIFASLFPLSFTKKIDVRELLEKQI